jgi:SARP family transcriptional regulator, regulator of embCAB operon
MPEVADGARVQLCGPFAVEVHGRSVGADRLGRQARVLFGYLTLCRSQPVPREALIDALWDEVPPPSANAALTVVVSRLRAVVGPGVIQGRGQLSVVLGEPARVDVEQALAALHTAESAVASGNWRRAWYAALTAQFVARRTLLPDATNPGSTGGAAGWPTPASAPWSATPPPACSWADPSWPPPNAPPESW